MDIYQYWLELSEVVYTRRSTMTIYRLENVSLQCQAILFNYVLCLFAELTGLHEELVAWKY